MIPQGSTRASHIEAIAEDLALALKVESVLVRSLPSEGCVGVFVPRPDSEITTVMWRDLMGASATAQQTSQRMILPICLGVDWLGNPVYDDLSALPHLLIGGSTGGGKSVFMRSIIATIVYNGNNKIVLSDTKGVEFTEFIGNPTLWVETGGEIATTPMRTIEQMDLLCKETDARLDRFGMNSCRNIIEYHQRTGPSGRGQCLSSS